MKNKFGKPHEKKALGEVVTAPRHKWIAIKKAKAKWVDDLTQVKYINLKEDTEKLGEESLVRPLQKHARTEHKMKQHMNRMHDEVETLYNTANKNQMKVNNSKTKTMLFNSSKKTDFEPIIETPEGNQLDYVCETKLLGTILTEDLKTLKNTQHMVAKTYKRMWVLRRLAHLTSDRKELIETYSKQIRPLVELAVPYWGTRITQYEVTLLERVQKTALHIIYGDKYKSYEEALAMSKLSTLKDRRKNLITSFAQKSYLNPKFNTWFVKKDPKVLQTRSTQQLLKEVPFRTKRYGNSTIPIITKIINNNYKEKPDDIVCDICSLKLTTESNLNKHIKYKHNDNSSSPQWNTRIIF